VCEKARKFQCRHDAVVSANVGFVLDLVIYGGGVSIFRGFRGSLFVRLLVCLYMSREKQSRRFDDFINIRRSPRRLW